MQILRRLAILSAFLGLASVGHAGLYYSGEQIAELPSRWRGFLLDQRALRQLAAPPSVTKPASPLRSRYEEARKALEKSMGQRKLNADELADLGALCIRLGEPAKAVELLRTAQREHPAHFRIVANLGTAWQLQGDLQQAASYLQQAVRLAPGKLVKAEELQLKLVRLRQREPRTAQDLDDLLGVRFVDEAGKLEPGKLAAAERKKLPSDAAALVQQLALWLPADGRLLWQLAELANAQGDIRTAAGILDGCVTEFGLHAPELRRQRRLLREAADGLDRNEPGNAGTAKASHEGHAVLFRPRSKRPLLSELDQSKLPPVSLTGVNALPWAILAETMLDRRFKPTFAKYLQELNGKEVSLTGFMQPLSEETELSSFILIEYPVGCWYCEMPEVTSIVLVELAGGKTMTRTRDQVKVTGKLSLNAGDPENFLYTIKDARVSGAD
jgi:hypothetical protein